MGNKPRTKELYNQVLAAARIHRDQHGKVARQIGIHRHTVRALWEKGWPDKVGCIPISEQIKMDEILVRSARTGADPEDQVDVARQVLTTTLDAARLDALDAADLLGKAAKKAKELEDRAQATLKEAQDKLDEVTKLVDAKTFEAERTAKITLANAEIQAKQELAKILQRAKVDAAETLADEANAAKFGRKAAFAATVIAAMLLKDAQVIANSLRTALGDISKLSPREAMRTAREMVRLVESAEKALILSFQAERLRLNQPTEVIGVASMDASLESRELKLRVIQRSLAKERAKLELVKVEEAPNGDVVSTGDRAAGAGANQ